MTPTAGGLSGQTVLVIGGTRGIGLATARRARAAGAELVITGRNIEHLDLVGGELHARTAAFDATDFDRLAEFFRDLPGSIDHVLVTGPGPYYSPLRALDLTRVRLDLESQLLLPIEVARNAAGKVRAGGTLLFMGGTGGRRTAPGFTMIATLAAAKPALTRSLALELAPIRVNLIAPGFVDTPLSAELLGDQLDNRREELRSTLPTGRVVTADDIAALAEHLMTNETLTGATYDIDSGQQLIDP